MNHARHLSDLLHLTPDEVKNYFRNFIKAYIALKNKPGYAIPEEFEQELDLHAYVDKPRCKAFAVNVSNYMNSPDFQKNTSSKVISGYKNTHIIKRKSNSYSPVAGQKNGIPVHTSNEGDLSERLLQVLISLCAILRKIETAEEENPLSTSRHEIDERVINKVLGCEYKGILPLEEDERVINIVYNDFVFIWEKLTPAITESAWKAFYFPFSFSVAYAYIRNYREGEVLKPVLKWSPKIKEVESWKDFLATVSCVDKQKKIVIPCGLKRTAGDIYEGIDCRSNIYHVTKRCEEKIGLISNILKLFDNKNFTQENMTFDVAGTVLADRFGASENSYIGFFRDNSLMMKKFILGPDSEAFKRRLKYLAKFLMLVSNPRDDNYDNFSGDKERPFSYKNNMELIDDLFTSKVASHVRSLLDIGYPEMEIQNND